MMLFVIDGAYTVCCTCKFSFEITSGEKGGDNSDGEQVNF
jgi:hypothetical protein